MSEFSKIAKAASVFGSGTLLSRITGLLRDQLTAYFFGASAVSDAFFIAWRLPNLLRRLLAEGALTAAFVPVFSQTLKQRGLNEAAALYKNVFTMLALALAAVTILGTALAPQLVALIAPGYLAEPDKYALTVLLTRIVFPYIFFVGLVALATGVLNSLGRFAAPALSPVLLNLSMIAGMWFLGPKFETPIISLALGALAGGFLQLALQIPFLLKAGPFWGLRFNFRDPAIKKLLILMGPAALGASAYQFSVFANSILASTLPNNSVSVLNFADRLMQFPLGIFSVAIATAVLPSLARQVIDGDAKRVGQTAGFALEMQFLITVPAAVGLMVMAQPLIMILFERGKFEPRSTALIAEALRAMALGLPMFSACQVLVRVFYSLSDTKTPTKIAAQALFSGVGLGAFLMLYLDHVGLALATSLSAMINFALLAKALAKKHAPIRSGLNLKRFWPYLGYSLLMAALLLGLRQAFEECGAGLTPRTRDICWLITGIPLGVLFYFALAARFSSSAWAVFRAAFKRRSL